MNLSRLGQAVLAVVLGVVGVVGSLKLSQPRSISLGEAVITTETILPGESFAGKVALVQEPATAIVMGTVESLKAVASRTASVELFRGDPVLVSDIGTDPTVTRAGIPSGDVGVVLQVPGNELDGVQNGQRVDIIATGQASAAGAVQAGQVLAADVPIVQEFGSGGAPLVSGPGGSASGAGAASSVEVAVSPTEAGDLAQTTSYAFLVDPWQIEHSGPSKRVGSGSSTPGTKTGKRAHG